MSRAAAADTPLDALQPDEAPPALARNAALGIKLSTPDESALLAEISTLAAQMRRLRADSRGNAQAIAKNLDAARVAWTALRLLRAGNVAPVTPSREVTARRARRAETWYARDLANAAHHLASRR